MNNNECLFPDESGTPVPPPVPSCSPDCDGCPESAFFCSAEPVTNAGDFYRLIDAMAYEIALLEAEVVRTRQVLSEYLPQPWADGLSQDIFTGLSARFEGSYEAYDEFLARCCNGIDPLESEEQVARLLRLRDGIDETTYYHLLPHNNR